MHCNDGQYVNSTFTFSSTIKLLKSKYESVSCHPPLAQVVIMLVKSIEVTLNILKRETEFRKLEVLYQQCLNRLSKVQGTTITEEALLEVPGFSEFVLSQIKNRMDNPPRKRKADESEPSKPAKKRQSGSSKQHRVEATVSDVFDHADDPEVVEIIAKQQQEARALSKRSRGGAGASKSLARMAERKMCQSEGASSRTKRKLSDPKINKDQNQPNIGKHSSSTKEKSHCQNNDQDDVESGDVDPDS